MEGGELAHPLDRRKRTMVTRMITRDTENAVQVDKVLDLVIRPTHARGRYSSKHIRGLHSGGDAADVDVGHCDALDPVALCILGGVTLRNQMQATNISVRTSTRNAVACI